jgi:hypothetical protein
MFSDDDIFDTLDYWVPEDDGFDMTDGVPPSTILDAGSSVFDLDNISTAEMEAWFLVPQPDGGLGEYAGTSTDSRDGLAEQAFESDQPYANEPDYHLPPTTPTPPTALVDTQASTRPSKRGLPHQTCPWYLVQPDRAHLLPPGHRHLPRR